MFHSALVRVAFSILVLIITLAIAGAAQVNVTTYHNDNSHTGQNTKGTILTIANVNSTDFGKLFFAIDRWVRLRTGPVCVGCDDQWRHHNVVYIATMHDSVHAFDADSNMGSNPSPLWMVNFTDPSAGITTVPTSDLHCQDTITTEVGILSTPVIDTSSNTIYKSCSTLLRQIRDVEFAGVVGRLSLHRRQQRLHKSFSFNTTTGLSDRG